MRIRIAISGLLLVLTSATCRADDPQACVKKVLESLPKVAGLTVKRTRTRPSSSEHLASWQGQTRPILVDADVVAVSAEETYSYLCAQTKGAAYVRRVAS
jgi:hypothetical protein